MAALALTLTETGQRGGGGMQCSWGTLAADTGDYTTGGIAPSPTFPTMDQISNREPDIVFFTCEDGYALSYDISAGKIIIRAQTATPSEDDALGELTTASGAAAAVGGNQQWMAIWFAQVP